MSLQMEKLPVSPIPRATDTIYSVRIQELAIKSTNVSPKRKQRTPSIEIEEDVPLQDEAKATSMRMSGYDITRGREQEPQHQRKRLNNKRASLSPSSSRRKTTEEVKCKGELVVAEEIQQRKRPPIIRTLGTIHCILVLKSDGIYLETVSIHRHHVLHLQVDSMDFVHERFQHENKFQLCYRGNDPLRSSSSYIFQAPNKEAYDSWVKGVLDHGACQANKSSSLSSSKRITDGRKTLRPVASLYDKPVGMGTFLYTTPPKIKHIILVRHGHYINAHTPHVSDSDQVLSQMGRQQADLTGKYLELLYSRSPMRHAITIYHSDMTRAVESATIMGKDFENSALRATRLLREGWPGRPYSANHLISQPPPVKPNENARELEINDSVRMEKAFTTFLSPAALNDGDDDEEEEAFRVIVCHANLIRYFLCRAMGIDPIGAWGHFEINHCGVTRIDICENRPMKVIAVNETGHLPHSLITSSEDHL